MTSRKVILADALSENSRLQEENARQKDTISRLLEEEERRSTREAENLKRLKSLEQLVTKDTLTGLLNRSGFHEAMRTHLSHASRSALGGEFLASHWMSLVYFDLDAFKPINDLFSHRVGDMMLMKFGNCIKDHVRPNDYVARLGGDEFVLLLKNVSDRSVAERIVEKIRDAVRKVTINGADEQQLALLHSHTGRSHVLDFSAGYVEVRNAQLNSEQLLDEAEHNVPKFARLRPARGAYPIS